MPRFNFSHCGTAVIVDPRARSAGFLIVDPSFIEKRLALSFSNRLAPHKLACYVRGLWGAAGAYGDEPPDAMNDPEPRDPRDLLAAAAPRSNARRCCWPRRGAYDSDDESTVDPAPLLRTTSAGAVV